MRFNRRIGNQKINRLTFRVSDSELHSYQELANKVIRGGGVGADVSYWIRQVLNNEVVRAKLAADKAAAKEVSDEARPPAKSEKNPKRKGAGRGKDQ